MIKGEVFDRLSLNSFLRREKRSATYREWGLCLHGVGLIRYQGSGHILMQVLELVLPMTESWIAGIADIIRSQSMDSNGGNGFAFLYRIMRDPLAIPLLKGKFVYPENPRWPKNYNIIVWAKRVNIHRRIMWIHGVTVDDLEASCIFLEDLQGSLYIQCAMGYSSTIHQAARLVDQGTGGFPFQYFVFELAVAIQSAATTCRLDTDGVA